LLGALLILYRILQPPGFNDAAVVKLGAPVGLVVVGVLAIASRSASQAERPAPEPAAAERTAGGDEDPEESQETPPAGYESPAEPAPPPAG
jgi:hypothetical protein